MSFNATELQTFTTSKAHLQVFEQLIPFSQFLLNVIFDLGLIVATCILWKLFWHSLNKLSIRNIKNGRDQPIGQGETILNNLKALYRIMKNLTLT